MMNRSLAGLAASLVLVAMSPGESSWAAYPSKPIRFIVTFPAGGTTDIVARMVTQPLGERLGQSIVIDNRGVMGGSFGMQVASKAAADGHTLVFTNVGSMTINTVLLKNVGYDPIRHFLPVIPVAAVPNFLVVAASLPHRTLAELIAAARASPGALTYAGTGLGASPTLAAEVLKTMAKVDITEVGYKGAAAAIADVLSGRVTMKFESAFAMQYIKAGKLRALGVSSSKRVAAMPDVPTIAEQGYPGFDVVAWYGIWAPAGTPSDIVQKLNTEIDAILKRSDAIEKMNAIGAQVMGGPVNAFSTYFRSEYKRWTAYAKDTGMKPQ